MKILGISAYYHDAAAALIEGDTILCAAQEERFTRVKHDPSFPANAIRFCLQESNLTIDQLDAIVFYDKPFLKFERLLETYYAFAPRGVVSFVKAIPLWVKEKLFLKKNLLQALSEIEPFSKRKLTLLFSEHHLSHAASAFYPSPFEESAILTIDGVGEWATASIGHGKGNQIKVLRELHFPHSLGLLYSAATYYLGFRVNSGEYKLMGLAPYADPEAERVQIFRNKIRTKLIRIKEDGSLWMNQRYFRYATSLRMVADQKWERLFGIPRRLPESPIEQIHCDLAMAIQLVTEEVVLKMAMEARRLTGSDNLCLAGGVALNSVANGKLERAGIFQHIFIQPAAGDAGGALGAALAGAYISFGQARQVQRPDAMCGALLGPHFPDAAILAAAERYQLHCQRYEDFNLLCRHCADFLASGKILGWCQDKMEFGPRALGNRSILADPRNPDTQQILNRKIKFREDFRPFAPAVLEEVATEYFQLPSPSPYMLQVHPLLPALRKQLPEGYATLGWQEKLAVPRSDIPGVTHVDFSARIQTVSSRMNPRFHALISAFQKKTGVGMLVNTSFNVRGEPIVCSPEDACRCFLQTEMDYLIFGNFLIRKHPG